MADIEYLTVSHLTIQEIKRLFSRVQVDSVSGCWNWLGAKDEAGYGFFKCSNVAQTRVHRIVYAWTVEPIPKGATARRNAQLDHLCRNTSCCNPVHLELVTQKENVARGVSPVALSMRKTHCDHGHPLTRTRNGKRRECKTCDSDRHKARLRGPKGERYREISRLAARRLYAKRKAEKVGSD